MGADLLDGDVELTEFVELDVRSVKGVKSGANGFPPLLMKGLAPAAKAPIDEDGDTDGPTHGAFTGKHAHPHTGSDGETHSEEHSHDGDGDHSTHDHAGKSARPDWVAEAVELVKAITGRGKVDETPDIDGGKQAIALIGKLIGYEAEEIAAGHFDEICDVQMLACAAEALKCWLALEQGADDDAGMLMQSAAKADMSTADINDLPDSAFAYIEPGGTKDESGKTTPRSKRHFPVHDKAHADNAAARIAQGAEFGDKALPKVKAAQRKFGSNSDDTSKSQIAEGGTTVDTETQETGSQIAKAVEDAVTKATAPLKERIESLGAELAKVKATPVPGGPMMTAVTPRKAADGDQWAAKARYYREMADSVSQDPRAADGYRQLARQADDKAKQAS